MTPASSACNQPSLEPLPRQRRGMPKQYVDCRRRGDRRRAQRRGAGAPCNHARSEAGFGLSTCTLCSVCWSRMASLFAGAHVLPSGLTHAMSPGRLDSRTRRRRAQNRSACRGIRSSASRLSPGAQRICTSGRGPPATLPIPSALKIRNPASVRAHQRMSSDANACPAAMTPTWP